jgi:hypothetical protein
MTRMAVLGVIATTSIAAADPATELGDLTAARKVIAETATCVPRPGKDSDTEIRLQLGFDPVPTLCAVGEGDKVPRGPLACWTIDVAKKRLVPAAPRLLAGELVRAKLAKGCTHGLCVPNVPADAEVRIGIDDSGASAVIVHGEMTYVFDRAKGTFKARSKVLEGASALDKAILSRDKIATIARPAGPDAIFDLDDLLDGPRKNPDGPNYPDAMASVYEGNAWLVAPGKILRSTAGFHDVSLLDVATGKPTTVRTRKPSRCLTFQHENPDKQAKCSTHKEISPYVSASVIATPTGYLAVLSGSRAGQLVALSSKLVETKLFDVYCRK